jgi:hypothetical protein
VYGVGGLVYKRISLTPKPLQDPGRGRPRRQTPPARQTPGSAQEVWSPILAGVSADAKCLSVFPISVMWSRGQVGKGLHCLISDREGAGNVGD